MDIYNLYPGSMGSNCYILISNSHAIVIDPSVAADKILDFINKKDATLERIILTHGHFDHMFSIDTLRNLTNVPLFIHEDDAGNLADGDKNAFKTFFGRDRVFAPAEGKLKDGDVIRLGDTSLKVISTPGHTKGSICLMGDGILITGDTLFMDSIGRCDLYSGNTVQMQQSLNLLRTFDGKLTIYPGHGDSTLLSHAFDNISYYY